MIISSAKQKKEEADAFVFCKPKIQQQQRSDHIQNVTPRPGLTEQEPEHVTQRNNAFHSLASSFNDN